MTRSVPVPPGSHTRRAPGLIPVRSMLLPVSRNGTAGIAVPFPLVAIGGIDAQRGALHVRRLERAGERHAAADREAATDREVAADAQGAADRLVAVDRKVVSDGRVTTNINVATGSDSALQQ